MSGRNAAATAVVILAIVVVLAIMLSLLDSGKRDQCA
jgi:hypothetical protein